MSEIPLPAPPRKAARPEPATPADHDLTAGAPDALPTVGGFYAQHRAVVDARRTHLARMGILPEHATALRMPDLDEKATPPAVHTESLPEVNTAKDYAAPRLPKLPGVNVSLDDAEE